MANLKEAMKAILKSPALKKRCLSSSCLSQKRESFLGCKNTTSSQILQSLAGQCERLSWRSLISLQNLLEGQIVATAQHVYCK